MGVTAEGEAAVGRGGNTHTLPGQSPRRPRSSALPGARQRPPRSPVPCPCSAWCDLAAPHNEVEKASGSVAIQRGTAQSPARTSCLSKFSHSDISCRRNHPRDGFSGVASSARHSVFKFLPNCSLVLYLRVNRIIHLSASLLSVCLSPGKREIRDLSRPHSGPTGIFLVPKRSDQLPAARSLALPSASSGSRAPRCGGAYATP